MPMWLDLTSVPFGNNARLSRVELSPCSVFFHFLTPNFMRSFSPLGRSGPARAEVGVGFLFVRLVQAFPSPPPPLVLFRVRRPPFFSSLALSGLARSGPGVLVLVFALSFFFCVPRFASWLSNLHLIFILISLSFPSSSSSPHLSRP